MSFAADVTRAGLRGGYETCLRAYASFACRKPHRTWRPPRSCPERSQGRFYGKPPKLSFAAPTSSLCCLRCLLHDGGNDDGGLDPRGSAARFLHFFFIGGHAQRSPARYARPAPATVPRLIDWFEAGLERLAAAASPLLCVPARVRSNQRGLSCFRYGLCALRRY